MSDKETAVQPAADQEVREQKSLPQARRAKNVAPPHPAARTHRAVFIDPFQVAHRLPRATR